MLPSASPADQAASAEAIPEPGQTEPAPPAGSPYGWHPSLPDETREAVTDTPAPLWRRIPLGVIVFVALLAVGAVSSYFFSASRSDSGEIGRSGDLDATDLRVGDCFDFKDPEADEFDQVTARPCSEEHEFEVFFVGTMPAETYPTDDAFDTYVTSACEPAFATYVGKSFQSSRLELTWVGPTNDLWNSGDHTVQCLLNDPQRQRLTTSLEGSNL